MYIPYGHQSINEEDIQAVIEVLKSDFLTTGPKVQEFEQKVAAYTGARYAVAVANGTAALHAACYAAGISEGDEVITSPITFAASANCVFYCKARPVFADIDPQTYNIDPDDVERKITNRTKAMIPVDFGGQPCDLDRIFELAKKYNLMVIEDAAHALGASYKGKKIGSISDMTIFSFHPVKHITTGEGGMVMTNDEELYQKLKLFRTHGITREEKYFLHGKEWKMGEQKAENEKTRNQEVGNQKTEKQKTVQKQDTGNSGAKKDQTAETKMEYWQRNPEDYEGSWYYEQVELGYNYRISDIQCALGISQMDRLEQFVERRRTLAEQYHKAFSDCKDIITPKQKKGADSSWHLYPIQILHHGRREIFEKLREAGIGVNVHYIPVYTFPYYQRNGYQNVYCKNAEELYKHLISLPLYPDLTDEQQAYVIDTLKDLLR